MTTTAKCLLSTDLFFRAGAGGKGTGNKWRTQAKAICNTCPMKESCLERGFLEHEGIWGGTTEAERKKLRAACRIKQGIAPGSNSQPVWDRDLAIEMGLL